MKARRVTFDPTAKAPVTPTSQKHGAAGGTSGEGQATPAAEPQAATQAEGEHWQGLRMQQPGTLPSKGPQYSGVAYPQAGIVSPGYQHTVLSIGWGSGVGLYKARNKVMGVALISLNLLQGMRL